MNKKFIFFFILSSCLFVHLESFPTKNSKHLTRNHDRHAKGLRLGLNALERIEIKLGRFAKGLSCTVCKVAAGLLHAYLELGTTEEEIVKGLTKLCINLKIEDVRVCTGIIPEFKEEVLTVFDMAVVTPGDICGTILGPSCAATESAYGPWNVTFPKGKKRLVRSAGESDKPKAGSPVSKVLQISDTHVDELYMEGANTKCGEPLCCRKTDGKAPKGVIPAGKFGYYTCDTPTVMLDSLFQHIKDNHQDIDYIIWTGDVPAHNVWNQSRTDQIAALKFAGEKLLKYFPNLKIYPALGNHEASPVNSFPPPFIKDEHSNIWLREALADLWGHWLPADTKPTILKGGYYTTLARKGLRIISLNMNYCNNMNWWLMINNKDPAGQLQWMIGVLEQAEKNNEKVHILGHIPPGSGDCLKHWSWNYYEIINRYSHVIAAQFFGHTHHDEFSIFYHDADVKQPSNIAYIGPSVTPFTNLNPGYRIYEVDGDYANSTQRKSKISGCFKNSNSVVLQQWQNKVVLDHLTYIIDLEKANKEGKATWELEYRATEAYGMKAPVLPSVWNDLVNRMHTNNTLFQLFNKFFYKSHPEPCTGGCITSTLCRLKSGRSSDDNVFCKFESEAHYKWYKQFNFNLRKC